MKTRPRTETGAWQFIVLPDTGLQICRGFPLSVPEKDRPKLWEAALRRARKQGEHEVLALLTAHVACNRELNATPWLLCDPDEFVFYRQVRTGDEVALDLVVDTHNGAGSQERNKIPISLETGPAVLGRKRRLADVFVEEHASARNEIGSLIVDFGNSGSAFIFSRNGAGPLQAHVASIANPFDPRYRERDLKGSNILDAGMIVLRVRNTQGDSPWLVIGERAGELVQEHPLATYVHAPKKYVRHWPEHLKAAEPTSKFRGLLGQKDGLHPLLDLVAHTVDEMLQQVIASYTNPHQTSDQPEFYPQVARVMLTWPLTWRGQDRELFRRMIERAGTRLLHHEAGVAENFRVELVCSEPVAVAAYVLWESFFHFGTENLALAASVLGNLKGTPRLRLLVVDIGGGSTDVACVDISWTIREEDRSVDVGFRLLESMRFNRAGDRLSHLIVTALREHLRRKYAIEESLDFRREARNAAFTHSWKRVATSRLAAAAERAKRVLSAGERFVLTVEEEREIAGAFGPLVAELDLEARAKEAPSFVLDEDTLEQWVREDRQALETNGEPGFMDVFAYLEELQGSLAEQDRAPHLCVLSGRTSRLGFIRRLAAEHLGLPLHRVRRLTEVLPPALRLQGHENMDKLAVVCGAQRFRFGDHIRFSALPDAPIFNRYLGTVRETPAGLKLNRIHIRPGDVRPLTIDLAVEPARDVRIGHAFREDGVAQVVANLSNLSETEAFEVALDVLDDYTVSMPEHPSLVLTEWVPGGTDIIVDNFCDTGRIDTEPEGFLRRIVERDADRWLES